MTYLVTFEDSNEEYISLNVHASNIDLAIMDAVNKAFERGYAVHDYDIISVIRL